MSRVVRILVSLLMSINLFGRVAHTQITDQVPSLEIGKCFDSLIDDEVTLPSYLFKQLSKSAARVGNQTSKIRLLSTTLSCKDTTVLTISLQNEDTPKRKAVFLTNGYFNKAAGEYYSPQDFCLDSLENSSIAIKVCQKPDEYTSIHDRVFITKCCEIDEVIDLQKFGTHGTLHCKPVGKNKTWSPVLYKDSYSKSDQSITLNFLPNHPKKFCKEGVDMTLMSLRTFALQDLTPFRVLQDGNVVEKIGRTQWRKIPRNEICVDGAQNFPLNEDGKTSGPFNGKEEDTVVIDCRNDVLEHINYDKDRFSVVYVVALAIAIFFLLATLLAHAILWQRQTIRGWTLMGYVTFLMLEFSFLILARLITDGGVLCTTAAIGTHFSALATFCWLTSMNFDIWWSFRTMNPGTTRKHQLKLFALYTLFSIAIPVCIVATGLELEKRYGDDPFSEIIVPEYGKSRCGLGNAAEFPYLFGPISFLLGCNLLFLCVTLYYIYKHQKVLRSAGVKTKILNDKLQFFGMLFLIAGVTWIFDVISWATTPTNAPTPFLSATTKQCKTCKRRFHVLQT